MKGAFLFAGGVLVFLSEYSLAFAPTIILVAERTRISNTKNSLPPLSRRNMSDKSTPQHEIVDDDDISQETFSAVEKRSSSSISSTSSGSKTEASSADPNQPESTPQKGGYRPIEEWHEETRDEKHVLTSLKQEKAKWASTFEDMGGDGI